MNTWVMSSGACPRPGGEPTVAGTDATLRGQRRRWLGLYSGGGRRARIGEAAVWIMEVVMVRFWVTLLGICALVLITDRLGRPSPEAMAMLAATPPEPVPWWLLGVIVAVALGFVGWVAFGARGGCGSG